MRIILPLAGYLRTGSFAFVPDRTVDAANPALDTADEIVGLINVAADPVLQIRRV